MNPHYAAFIYASYGLALVVLVWNVLAPRLRRNAVRRQLSEAVEETDES